VGGEWGSGSRRREVVVQHNWTASFNPDVQLIPVLDQPISYVATDHIKVVGAWLAAEVLVALNKLATRDTPV
jgi:hypothetical protein